MQGPAQIPEKVGGLINGNVVSSGNGDMHDLPAAIGYFHGAGLADTGVCTGEIFIVLHRNQSIQSFYGQGCIFPSKVPALTVRAAGCPVRINDLFHPQWFVGQKGDLLRLDITGLSNAVAIRRPDILHPGGQTGPLFAIAEGDRGFVFIIGLGDEITIRRLQTCKGINLMPLHVIDNYFQGTVDTGRIGCSHMGEGKLLQFE